MLESEGHPVVFFDGVCNFCNSSVDFLIRNNPKRTLRYCSLQSDQAKNLFEKFEENNLDLNSVYFYHKGKLSKKSTAALKLIPHLKWYFGFLYGLWIIPSPIRNWGYDIIARNRYKLLGKRESCRLPVESEKSLFLG